MCVCMYVCMYVAVYSCFEAQLVSSPNRRTSWTDASENERYWAAFSADQAL
jgi:hypothetical protein